MLRIISGARYSGVPHSVQVRPFTRLAKPKSVTWKQNSRSNIKANEYEKRRTKKTYFQSIQLTFTTNNTHIKGHFKISDSFFLVDNSFPLLATRGKQSQCNTADMNVSSCLGHTAPSGSSSSSSSYRFILCLSGPNTLRHSWGELWMSTFFNEHFFQSKYMWWHSDHQCLTMILLKLHWRRYPSLNWAQRQTQRRGEELEVHWEMLVHTLGQKVGLSR